MINLLVEPSHFVSSDGSIRTIYDLLQKVFNKLLPEYQQHPDMELDEFLTYLHDQVMELTLELDPLPLQ